MLGGLFSEPLAVGTVAPDFSLPDETGQLVTLSALHGRPVVLVFYPWDSTPHCTTQLCQFRDQWNLASTAGAAVFGINPLNAGSHAAFREKHQFPFPLLVDEGRKVAQAYHASALVVKRTVYLVGPDGTIRFARRGMPAPAEVLAAAGPAESQ